MRASDFRWLSLLFLPLAVAGDPAAASSAGRGPGVADFALDRTDAAPVAANTRLVVFRYSDQVSFTIRSIPHAFTNIELPANEVAQGVYISDPSSWGYHVTEDQRRVLVRPIAPGTYSTGTIVTDKRSYELTLIAVEPGQPWMQRVRWEIPDAALNSGVFETARSPSVVEPATNPESLHFGYDVRGRASFAPSVVFDDGVRTWFRVGSPQDLPAIFAVSGGKVDVVDFVRRGEYIVATRVSPEWRLRLGRQEVRVVRGR